jgi:transcriptional regulator with XRE-family HTH domain
LYISDKIGYNFKKEAKGDHMYWNKRIRDLREDHDKTQQEIADVLGTSQTMYARYERGANELPLRHLITLCKYYGVSADYILGLSDKQL